MPPTPDDRIADLADAMLAAVVDRYAASGVPLPDRQYVHAGEVAYDCEQLVVSLEVIYPGLPGAEDVTAPPRSVGIFAATARLGVHLVRCVPKPSNQGKAPSADALQTAGRALLIDSREVLKSLTIAKGEGVFTPLCQTFIYVGTDFVGSEGGFLGIVTRCDAQL